MIVMNLHDKLDYFADFYISLVWNDLFMFERVCLG